MRFIVMGHQRHGKDTACEYLREQFKLPFTSSSEFACRTFLFEQMREEYGYATWEECFADRVNHRAYWFEAICEYNRGDLARLGRGIFEKHNVYCGIRERGELNALKATGTIDLVVWVDASGRLPLEDGSSMNLTADDADVIVTNNGTLEEFHAKLEKLGWLMHWAGVC